MAEYFDNLEQYIFDDKKIVSVDFGFPLAHNNRRLSIAEPLLLVRFWGLTLRRSRTAGSAPSYRSRPTSPSSAPARIAARRPNLTLPLQGPVGLWQEEGLRSEGGAGKAHRLCSRSPSASAHICGVWQEGRWLLFHRRARRSARGFGFSWQCLGGSSI